MATRKVLSMVGTHEVTIGSATTMTDGSLFVSLDALPIGGQAVIRREETTEEEYERCMARAKELLDEGSYSEAESYAFQARIARMRGRAK